MPRPLRCRRITRFPEHWRFVSADEDSGQTIVLSLDEYETVFQIDHEGKTQEECAESMGVSRTTVTAIYDSARKKLARYLIDGGQLQIGGGTYKVVSERTDDLKMKEDDVMRIAMTYENGEVGQHFGRTEYFKLYDVEEGKIVNEQVISTNGQGHGALAVVLKQLEADVLICGGIGMGARMGLQELGIELLPGVSGSCDDVIKAYLENRLVYDPDAACHHHDHEEGHDCHHAEGGCCH